MQDQVQLQTEMSELGSPGFEGGNTGAARKRSNVNVVLRPHHFRCRLCAFSGFSVDCEFVRGDKCAGTVALIKEW